MINLGIKSGLLITINIILLQGPYELWKVLEIDNAIFQDLESYGN